VFYAELLCWLSNLHVKAETGKPVRPAKKQTSEQSIKGILTFCGSVRSLVVNVDNAFTKNAFFSVYLS
jgi:hypothetical protein